MMTYLIAYGGAAIVFFGLDFVWLSTMGQSYYRSQIGHVLLDKPNLVPAGVFYLFYVAGLVYFAIAPALAAENWTQALIAGALLGLLAYGTYDMTNLATVKDWSVTVTIIDMAWGAALSAIAATAGYFAARLIGG